MERGVLIFIVMNLRETIRRILNEETTLISRRVEIDKLNEEFNESLEHTSDMFFRDPEMTLDMFTHIVISMTIDGIHYDIHSTTHEDSQWYDDVFNSLKDYYKRQIKHRYNLLSEV
jgi:UTP:GlnB (protein PII) uridylyltransferase